MNKTSKWWRIAAVAFVFINVAGAVYALVMREQMHMELHLALLGGFYVGWLFRRASAKGRQQALPAEIGDARIDYLQQSVDAMALEIERMGEAQRFNEKLKAERKEPLDEPTR